MDDYPLIAAHFTRAVEAVMASVDDLAPPLSRAGLRISEAFLEDRKLLVCGDSLDAPLARLLTGNLLGQSAEERPALPAMLLGCGFGVAGGSGEDDELERRIDALGQPGDILCCIVSGTGRDILAPVFRATQRREMGIILLSGPDLGDALAEFGPDAIQIAVAAEHRETVIEVQTMLVNALSELVERHLFGFSR